MSKYEIECPSNLFKDDCDRQLEGKRFLLDAIDIALQSEIEPTNLDYISNAEPQYVGRSRKQAGWKTSPEISIKYQSPVVDVEVTLKECPQLDFAKTADPTLEISLEELHDGHNCPVCDEEFDTALWENVTEFGENDKAEWVYACPTDCEGAVVLITD